MNILDGCKNIIPPEEHIFTDALNLNNLYYRGKLLNTKTHSNCFTESEVAAKVHHDYFHLRDNDEKGERLYQQVHHPLCYCEEFQSKVYAAE